MSPWCCFMDCVVEAMYRSGMLLSTHRPINRMNSLSTPKALRAEAPPWRRLCVLWTEASIPIAVSDLHSQSRNCTCVSGLPVGQWKSGVVAALSGG